MVHFRNVVLSAATLAVATAQRVSRIVPAEISSGFDEDIQVQASYDDNAVNGFQDGTAFEKDGNPTTPLSLSLSLSLPPIPTLTHNSSRLPRTHLRPRRQHRHIPHNPLHHPPHRHHLFNPHTTLRPRKLQKQLRHHKHRHRL
ncbi:hypothetical protein NX059_008196 [Plenodomus lindquistii]|nr:hypothetical protein NX059_008196 [Plenodomus lindquistii]